MDLKSLLNKEQYEGASTVEGQVLILAGAGSGKTRVLTYRMAHMIDELGIAPWKILAITFTNKASKEMRDRVRSIIGEKADSMWISTFHSTCVRILRRDIDKLGYKSSFTIYDTSDQKVLLKECMKALNINEKDITLQEVMGKIGRAKDTMQTPSAFMRENEQNFREKKIADVYAMYQRRLKENNALDFDDLIFKAVELFKTNAEALEFYQNKFQYIMVDEYQDTNGAQYELVRMLAKKYKNICVVGDDDQCIYQWRGADIQNILDFEKDYPDCKVIKLEQNYRSKGNILDAANEVIVNNSRRKDKALRTEQESGSKIKVYRAFSDKEEADFAAREIKETIANEENSMYKNFAVLYRTNAQSRNFEECFRRRGIPYKIIGGTKFYDRKEIKDMLAYLKILVNPQDDVSIRRVINVPKRSIGAATLDKVQNFAGEFGLNLWDALSEVRTISTLTARNCSSIEKFTSLMDNFVILAESMPPSVLIENILKESGYLAELEKSEEIEDKSRIENLKELVSDAVQFEKDNIEANTLSDYLENVALVQDADKDTEEEDYVVLMTLHSAKGLEFPYVFMVGMENGLFPSVTDINEPSQMEESRRLCYVGITRAKEMLYMTSAEKRMLFGRITSYSQSDFINEIRFDLKEFVNGGGKVATSQTPNYYNSDPAQQNSHGLRGGSGFYNKPISKPAAPKNSLNSSEISVGKKVNHDKFGRGTIVSMAEANGDKKLTIVFDKQGIKTLMLSMANLELV